MDQRHEGLAVPLVRPGLQRGLALLLHGRFVFSACTRFVHWGVELLKWTLVVHQRPPVCQELGVSAGTEASLFKDGFLRWPIAALAADPLANQMAVLFPHFRYCGYWVSKAKTWYLKLWRLVYTICCVYVWGGHYPVCAAETAVAGGLISTCWSDINVAEYATKAPRLTSAAIQCGVSCSFLSMLDMMDTKCVRFGFISHFREHS